ncbi:MAG: tRNA (adenosine(37)-N6)-threonylcarbamoyltransferase complex transferase subunit TsaD [Bacteroidia bacterium]|nr:MAG: tRNA (adenosine(37)-N6)-threonylcarbamoyltransferase complex transferase subunit TsaD [Bacteroidia bacterium]
MNINILGIESSCDDTSAAVIQDEYLLSNVIANQEVHFSYGGVVPELASRAHQQNIIPVVERALVKAGIGKSEISAIAFTRGPGLLGSLLVGTSFAKGFALANNIPLIEINHLQGHVLAPFIREKQKENPVPSFPFLSLLISGGHSQIIVVKNHYDFKVIGNTIDDAVGEAFDKCAKIMGLGYPGGPVIDKLAKTGNPNAFAFAKPRVADLNYSFSGLKTSFLYFLRDNIAKNKNFIEENKADLCAALQHTIIEILIGKLIKAVKQTGIKEIAIGGGVAANSGIREKITQLGKKYHWNVYLPEFRFTTDNAAMIAIVGYYKYLKKDFARQDIAPMARFEI